MRYILTVLAVGYAAFDANAASRIPVTNEGKGRHAPTRFVVISDVDDTIKDTGVTVGRTHLKNIPWILLDPLRTWAPVPGMSALYQGIHKKLGAGFLYVSKGPAFSRSSLQRAITRFHFPNGEIRLNSQFPSAPADYKFRVIAPIIRDSPRQHYILIGDSGELDPENYGLLARTFPRQVDKIFIRSVTADWEGRYRCAFHEVPHSKWEVFAWPQDLRLDTFHN